MRFKRTWLWVAVLTVGLSLFALGCSGGGDDKGDDGGGGAAAEQVITVNWGTEPPSLDPGLASDTTSAAIIFNIMDPLITLDEDLNPVENAAESYKVSEDGTTVTLTLRDDLEWTNGDPVTAEDYEWSWKRTVSPELGADYAYQFFGIVGASDYNSCDPAADDCDALAEEMGVEAVDERTLRVTLTSAQPWFIQQMAHTSFIAVHRPTVEKFGENWTDPANIVTNGPFRLDTWEHNSRIDLVKWEDWRNADEVSLTRVNGRMITDGTTAVQAYEAGEIDVNLDVPPEEIGRLKETEDYQQYPTLGTYYYGLNVETVTDPLQRRAMALAIDRRTIIDNITQADELPASGFTPEGMPGFETINPESEFLPENGNMERAKELMSQVQNPKTDINLLLNDAPGHREIAVAVQANWQELGLNVNIRQQEWAQFLEAIGPPPSKNIDAFRLGWIADYPDAINFLELWTTDSGNNSTNYGNEEYDRLVEEARATPDNGARYELYSQLEDILFGEDADMPVVPIYWYTFTHLERPSIQETFNINPTSQIDLRVVEVRE
ncbi:MAG: peptide ABC transporter substrate-binding protein [Acidobacteriota bacterium]